jgi:CheY-like chemotaxis protein/HPt (histidine-containing phosphotransfer) domain-containing protein
MEAIWAEDKHVVGETGRHIECCGLGRGRCWVKAIAGEKEKESPRRRRQKAPTVAEATAMGQLILMAEDNPTNQALLGRQLSRLGFAAEVANDGEEALAAMAEKPYAILLTDCHMPNMDGYELARSVRRSEEGNDARLPIIAITASAMQEDAERCFEAGMDDFLVKPVDLDKLKTTLQRWMPTADEAGETVADNAASVAAPAVGEASGAAAVVDVSVLAEAFGGDADEDLLRHMLGVFIEPAREAVAKVRQGLDDRSADDIAAAAHTLKSSSRSIGAHDLAALCETLEAAARSEDWPTIEETAPPLEPTLDRVLRFIDSY